MIIYHMKPRVLLLSPALQSVSVCKMGLSRHHVKPSNRHWLKSLIIITEYLFIDLFILGGTGISVQYRVLYLSIQIVLYCICRMQAF